MTHPRWSMVHPNYPGGFLPDEHLKDLIIASGHVVHLIAVDERTLPARAVLQDWFETRDPADAQPARLPGGGA